MKRNGLWPTSCLLFGALCGALAGCGQTGDEKGGKAAGKAAGGATGYSVEDLKRNIGEYMPPLERRTLEIAAPRGWDWAPAGAEYLVGFHKKDSSLNNLPRILVTAEDSPFPGISDVNKENVDQLVKLVSESVDATKLKGTVQPIILGNAACARYVDMAKRRNALVARQTLKTVARGRLYTIRLEAYDREFTKYRDMAYAVAASMKFAASGTPETAPEVSDDTETADPKTADPKTATPDEPSPAKDAEPQSDPAATDSE